MLRLIFAASLTFTGVLFSAANTHHVALRLPIGPPVSVRLIFLLASTFLAGVLTTSFVVLLSRVRERRRKRAERQADALATATIDTEAAPSLDEWPEVPQLESGPGSEAPARGLLRWPRRSRGDNGVPAALAQGE